MTSLPLFAAVLAAVALTLGACSGKSDESLLASARTMLQKNDIRGAVIQLRSVLQQNPKSGQARLLLGKLLLENGDPSAAAVELRKAQELQVPDDELLPALARAMLSLGESDKIVSQFGGVALRDPAAAADLKSTVSAAYGTQGDVDGASRAAADALRAKPGFAPALIMQARLSANAGEVDAALSQLDGVLASNPANEQAGVLKGEILLRARRDRPAAIAAFRQVLAAVPNSIVAQASLIDVLLQERKIDEARVAVQALRTLAPNHPETLFHQAQLAFVDRDNKTVRELTERILKVIPDSPRVLELAGAAEFGLRQYVQAEALLARALKNAPRQLRTRQLLAQTFLRSGQPGKAIEALQPVLETAEPDGTSLALAGEAYLQLGDNRRSDDAFQRAVKAAPGDSRVRTSAAVAQLAQGHSGAVLSELEALAVDDSGPRADLALISARLRQGDTAGALKAADGLAKKLPEQPLAYNLRGRILLLQKDTAGAARAFETALSKDPNYFPSIASLAAIDLSADKPELARGRFEAYLKSQPNSYQAALALAELAARTNAPPEEVTRQLRAAVRMSPAETLPNVLLVNRLLSAGDAKAALAAAQEANAAAPNNLGILDALGRAQLAGGDSLRAIATFKQLAGLQPTNPQHELRLADAYMAAKDTEGAGASLRRALQLEPELPAARRGLALLALQANKPDEALAIARNMQKSKPRDAAGFALEGEIQSAGKNWDAAVAAYRAVVQRAPVTEAAVRLHLALMSAGKRREADQVASDWLKTQPGDATFLFYLGDAALAQGEWVQAEARYRAVLAAQPSNALALNNLAWVLVKQGKAGALPLAQQAIALVPGKATLHDTLSMALEADNQLGAAIDAQRRAIELAPGDPTLSLRLAQLYLKQGDKARARAELEALSKRGSSFSAHAEVERLLKAL